MNTYKYCGKPTKGGKFCTQAHYLASVRELNHNKVREMREKVVFHWFKEGQEWPFAVNPDYIVAYSPIVQSSTAVVKEDNPGCALGLLGGHIVHVNEDYKTVEMMVDNAGYRNLPYLVERF